MKLRQLPPRLATGVFILDSGWGKQGADDDAAKKYHEMAANAYPFLRNIPPKTFTRLLSAGELALGAALVLPVVPAVVAGSGLAAFSTGLLGMYLRMPGTTREGSVLPSEQGIPLAKDVWMLGTGLGLVLDSDAPKKRRRRGALLSK